MSTPSDLTSSTFMWAFNGLYKAVFPEEVFHNFTPEEQLAIFKKYRDDIGIEDDFNFSQDAFNQLVKEKNSILSVFKTKGPDGLDIAKLLMENNKDTKDTEDKKYVTNLANGIKNTLAIDEDFKKAQTEYQKSMADFDQLRQKIPKEFKAEQLIGFMTHTVNEAIAAIEVRQAKEEADLKSFLDTQDTDIKKAFTITSDDVLKQVKAAMMEDLKTSQETQKDAFIKSTTDSLKKVHSAVQKQQNEFLFIAHLYESNKEMQHVLKQLAESKSKKSSNLTLGIQEDKVNLQNIRIEDIPMIISTTKRSIMRESDGSYSLKLSTALPNPFGGEFWRSPGSYDPQMNAKEGFNSPHIKGIQSDLRLMAQAVKACGYEYITQDISGFKNEEVGKARARLAFKAAVDAGYDFDKITIKINGKVIKQDELFQGHQTELDSAEKAQKDNKQNKFLAQIAVPKSDRDQILPEDEIKRFKAAIEEIRASKVKKEDTNEPVPVYPTVT